MRVNPVNLAYSRPPQVAAAQAKATAVDQNEGDASTQAQQPTRDQVVSAFIAGAVGTGGLPMPANLFMIMQLRPLIHILGQ